ncbi:MAG: hypothetical protein NC311_02800 [Muribaculaceae bacterium]|nr:hypothetical protein [Muribaculaceae bacterium]
MNKILKLALYTLFACAVMPAVADDVDVASTQSVTARMDCKTMKAKIDELNASGATDDAAKLQQQYRRDCVMRVSGLRSSYRGGALTVAAASAEMQNVKADIAAAQTDASSENNNTATTETVQQISDEQAKMCERLPDAIDAAADDTKSVLQETYDAYCAKTVAAPDTVIKTTMLILGPETPAETDEEKYARIAANLDAGLCPDGSKPNKFGCCGDEVFKDLGNLEFACCPKDGGECFPPVK